MYKGYLNADRYKDIIEENLLPNWKDDGVLQQDGAKAHTARKMKDFFRDKNINYLTNWPPQSPDLNIIENVWFILKNSIEKRNVTNIHEFERAVYEEFNNISNSYIETLYKSFWKRLRDCLRAKGKSIAY